MPVSWEAVRSDAASGGAGGATGGAALEPDAAAVAIK